MNQLAINFEELIQRNIGVITPEEQNIIKNKHIAIVDLGDQDIAAVLSAKIGFLKINIADSSNIELNHLNSQFMATSDRIDQKKTEIAKEIILKHNPLTETDITTISPNITVNQAKKIIGKAEICLITTHNPYLRIIMTRASELLQIPYIVSINLGFKVMISAFQPGGINYEQFTCQPSLNQELSSHLISVLTDYQYRFAKHCQAFLTDYAQNKNIITYSIPTVSFFAANIATAELVKIVINKGKIHYAPNAYTLDLLTCTAWDINKVIEAIN